MVSPITPTIMNNYVKQFNGSYNLDLGTIFDQICQLELIAQDIAFAQAVIETQNFTRAENMSKFNSGGILAVGSSSLHTFPNWNDGITAHVQHLLAYATNRANFLPLRDPRWSFVARNTATTIDALQNRWTSQAGYANAVKSKVLDLYRYAGLNPQYIN